MIDLCVIVNMLITLGQVKAVKVTLRAFAGENRLDVVAHQSAA